MNQDIIRMAREAGFVVDEKAHQHQPNCIFHTHHMIDELLKRFAVLVADAEREVCAEVCEAKMPQPVVNWADAQIVEALRDCAATIRARSNT